MKSKISLILMLFTVSITNFVLAIEQETYDVELENRTILVTLRGAKEPGVAYQLSLTPQPAEALHDIASDAGSYYNVNSDSRLIIYRFLGIQVEVFDKYQPKVYNKSLNELLNEPLGSFEIHDEIISSVLDPKHGTMNMISIKLKVKFEVKLIERKFLIKMIGVEQES